MYAPTPQTIYTGRSRSVPALIFAPSVGLIGFQILKYLHTRNCQEFGQWHQTEWTLTELRLIRSLLRTFQCREHPLVNPEAPELFVVTIFNLASQPRDLFELCNHALYYRGDDLNNSGPETVPVAKDLRRFSNHLQ